VACGKVVKRSFPVGAAPLMPLHLPRPRFHADNNNATALPLCMVPLWHIQRCSAYHHAHAPASRADARTASHYSSLELNL
jgi:hypothetical protein